MKPFTLLRYQMFCLELYGLEGCIIQSEEEVVGFLHTYYSPAMKADMKSMFARYKQLSIDKE